MDYRLFCFRFKGEFMNEKLCDNPSGGAVHDRARAWHVPAAVPVYSCDLNLRKLRDRQQRALRRLQQKASPHGLTREAINT
jgi:hypothetical protein